MSEKSQPIIQPIPRIGENADAIREHYEKKSKGCLLELEEQAKEFNRKWKDKVIYIRDYQGFVMETTNVCF